MGSEDLKDALTTIDGIGTGTAEDIMEGADDAGLILALAGEEQEVDGGAVLGELEEALDHLPPGSGDYAGKHIRRAIDLLRPPDVEE